MSLDNILENHTAVPPESIEFEDIPQFQKRLTSYISDFDRSQTGTQFVVFRGVTAEIFERIEWLRDRVFKGVRLGHNLADNTLVVKMHSALHELSFKTITSGLDSMLWPMGLRRSYRWLGATRFLSTTSRRSKEGDQVLMPVGRIAVNNFPSFVIEVGVSEGLNGLRADAEFWLLHTTNDCRLVLVVAMNRTSRWMAFELYQRGTIPGRVTRNKPNPPPVPIATLRQPQIVLQHSGGVIGPPDLNIPLGS